MRHSKPPIVLLFCLARFSSERLQGRKIPACDASKQTFFTGGGCARNPICVLCSVAPAASGLILLYRKLWAHLGTHMPGLLSTEGFFKLGFRNFTCNYILQTPILKCGTWALSSFIKTSLQWAEHNFPNSRAVSVFCRADLIPVEDLNERLRLRKLKFETLSQHFNGFPVS